MTNPKKITKEEPIKQNETLKKEIETYKVNSTNKIIAENHLEDEIVKALKKSETNYSILINSINEGLGITDVNEKFIFVNPSAEKIFGVNKGKLIGRSLDEFLSEDNKKLIREQTNLRTKGEQSTYDLEIIHLDGSKKYLHINAIPQFDNNGIFTSTLGTFKDITERKYMEEEINNSHKLLQRIIDILPVRIFWKDTNLNYLGCNSIFAKDGGRNSTEELIGKNDFDMSWKEYAELYRKDDQEVITSKKPKLDFEEPQTTPTGDKIWLKTSKMPLTNQQGEIIGILGMYEDITERKKSEEEIHSLVDKLKKSNITKDKFFSMIAHDS